jgi:cell division protein ZapE
MRDSAFDIAEELQSFEEGRRLDVLELYQRMLADRGFVSDAAQFHAVERLQRLYEEFTVYKARRDTALKRLVARPELPRGVYLWGGVGRGKSFLMDSFFLCVPLIRKRRVHFHHFMRDVHRELDTLKGQEDPLVEVAKRIAKRYRLICFDEFHVGDIGDAMILGRLLDQLIQNRVVLCMTSNYRPDELYANGLQRANFLPAIELIKTSLDVLEVDGGADYRRRALEQVRAYHAPLGTAAEASLREVFARVAEVAEETHELDVEGRIIPYVRRAGGVVWFEFSTLCEGPRSQLDYLDLAQRFHTVILSNIPRMSAKMADAARRFTWLVDIFYDQKVKLVVSAEVAAPELYPDGSNSFEFARTVSRLIEMQSRIYLSAPRTASGATHTAAPVEALPETW